MAKNKPETVEVFGVAPAASLAGSVAPGRVVTLPRDLAEDMIAAGYAVRNARGMTIERARAQVEAMRAQAEPPGAEG